MGDHKMTDVAKAAGVQWKAMSEAAKKPYEDKFKKKQAEFSKAMEEYKKDHPDAANDEDDDEEDGEEEDQPEAKSEAAPKKKARKAGAYDKWAVVVANVRVVARRLGA